jgi:phosphoglycolate phosphatase
MISRYSHISFDLDGTLVHTKSEYRLRVIPRVVKGLGGYQVDAEAIEEFWFRPNRSKVIREKFGVDPAAFWEAFGKVDTAEQRNPFTHVYPDVLPAMKRLNEMGKTISIITGAPQWIAEMEIAKLAGVTIDHILPLNGSSFSEKPCPDGMHYVLDQMGRKANETLYVGNGMEDGLFAEAAGCDFLLIDRREYAFAKDHSFTMIQNLDELFGTDASRV